MGTLRIKFLKDLKPYKAGDIVNAYNKNVADNYVLTGHAEYVEEKSEETKSEDVPVKKTRKKREKK